AAATYARAYLLTHPHAWQLRYVLASVELALTRTDEAKQELRHVVEDAPDHAEAYYLLATLAPDARAPSAATRELYDHYLALAPNGPHAYEARSFLRMQPEPEAQR
ncbi:MAG TPA: tetratricopeptide repeat protein, partial [Steroidobacteraceae bacterium]